MNLKPVKGFSGIYEVSESGEVFSINYRRSGKHTRLSTIKHNKGYRTVVLTKSGKSRHFLVHRLVAEAFLAPKNGKSLINHKNGDKSDNRVKNLEWCTHSENLQHSYDRLGRISGMKGKYGALNKNSVKIIQLSKENAQISIWDSIADAARGLNLIDSNICRVAAGKSKTHGGFIWRYAS